MFELFFPPTTITASLTLESSSILFCLTSVAEHIVLNDKSSLTCGVKLLIVFFQFSSFSVVCDTAHTLFGSSSLNSPLVVTIASLLHQPFIPATSGCFLSPKITILYPKEEYLLTFFCIFVT